MTTKIIIALHDNSNDTADIYVRQFLHDGGMITTPDRATAAPFLSIHGNAFKIKAQRIYDACHYKYFPKSQTSGRTAVIHNI